MLVRSIPAATLFSALLVLVFAGCRNRPEQAPPMEVYPEEKDYSRPLPPGSNALRPLSGPMPSFEFGFEDQSRLVVAVEHSLKWIDAPSSASFFPFAAIDGPPVTQERLRASLLRFREILGDARLDAKRRAELIAREFEVYESVGWDGSGTVLFTAYCEYQCEGSLVRSQRFAYPLYKRPDDLEEMVARDGKYHDRRRIDDEGVLRGRNLELVFLETPLDAYLVQIQGSARIKLQQGGMLRVGWAGDNNHEYRSIGQQLLQEGKINPNRYSLEELKKYFDRHPEELGRVLPLNPRYVFFRETTTQGPFGSLGVPVTPRVSIATDKSIFPRASLCFIDTTLPVREDSGGYAFRPCRTFVFDQDTGGAIRSAGRTDIFLGFGRREQDVAGHTRQEGRLYYLFLKPEIAARFGTRLP
ncbi:MAG: MltA domain-containing protein [Planctomycetes bacterium]|nr:MltA domain-containing protein [Planctomycetota bacterium]